MFAHRFAGLLFLLASSLSGFSLSQVVIPDHPVQKAFLRNESGTFSWPTFPNDLHKPLLLQAGGVVDGWPGDGQGGYGSQYVPIIMLAFGSTGQGRERTDSQESRRCMTHIFQQFWSCLRTLCGFQQQGDEEPPERQSEDTSGNDRMGELAVFMVMLAEIEALLEQLEGQVVLVTDMDDTILPYDRSIQIAIRARFREFIEKWRHEGRLQLVIVTRAEVTPDIWHFFAQNGLPEPDYLVAGANPFGSLNIQSRPGLSFTSPILPGSIISEGVEVRENGITIRNYDNFVYERLQGLFRRLLTQGFPVVASFVRDRECTVEFSDKYSLETYADSLKAAISDIFGALAKVTIDPSKHQLTVSMPFTKGALISRLARLMSLEDKIIIAAGDQTDDQGLMISGSQGTGYRVSTAVVVGNASKNLKGIMSYRDHTIVSTHNYLAGVVDGMLQGLRRLPESQSGSLLTGLLSKTALITANALAMGRCQLVLFALWVYIGHLPKQLEIVVYV